MKPKIFRVIGLMSGTSIDGIDAALIETDGFDHVRPLAFLPNPYDEAFRVRLRQCLGNQRGSKDPFVAAFERELTERHAEIVHSLLAATGETADKIDLIGFHGQTIWHQPKQRVTIQIGDGALLAKLTGIHVVNDFRSADVKVGGHGAPLVPLYHRALASHLPKPVAVMNVGGVSNVTWLSGDGDDEILAFDVGPGNALLDDWVLRHTSKPYDEDGKLAARGRIDDKIVDHILALDFFSHKPPKSLDRDRFSKVIAEDMSAADGAATLTMITARAIARSLDFMQRQPLHLYVTGGGRHNATLMRWIRQLCVVPVSSVDGLGWSGDGLEAEAFAYLAVRSHLGLPLSLPNTTGAPVAMTGGRFHSHKGIREPD